MAGRLLLIVALCGVVTATGAAQPGMAGAASPATTAAVRGRVDVRSPIADPEPRPGVADLGTDPIYRGRDRRAAVVYFESAPRAAFEGTGTVRATLSQADETFVPHVLAVRAGTIVDFPNNDIVYHNVFSLSRTRRFDLGRYAKGQSKSVRFDEPGIIRVFCDIHSHMNAFILVFAHRFFAVTDDQGRYRIDEVPPGTYTLVVWYEGAVRETRSVTVPEAGGAVDADFTVR